MTKLTDEEMEYRDQMGYAGTPDHWMREAHAALRAEREKRQQLRDRQGYCYDANPTKPKAGLVYGSERAIAAVMALQEGREKDRRLLDRCRQRFARGRPASEALLRDLDARLGKEGSDG